MSGGIGRWDGAGALNRVVPDVCSARSTPARIGKAAADLFEVDARSAEQQSSHSLSLP